MKKITQTPLLLSLLLLAGCQTTSDTSRNSSSSSASTGEPKARLVIVYDEAMQNPRPARYNTIDNEQDRFYYLEQNFEQVFQKKLSGYDLDFQLFPASPDEAATFLDLSLLSFDSPSPIELELRMWAILRQGETKTDFGVIRTRIVPQRPMTDGSIERDLNALYTNSAEQVLQKVSGVLQ